MNVESKLPERLYAQTLAYAENQPYPHSRELIKDVGGVATALLQDEVVRTERTNYKDEVVEVVEHDKTTYVDFLRKADPETRADITFLTNKMQDHDRYRSTVDTVLEGANVDSAHFLGRGLNGSAFGFTQDGEELVVKKGGVSYSDVAAFRKGEAIEGIAHLKSIDIDNEVSVMDLVPGRIPAKVEKDTMLAISEEQLVDVIGKAIAMYDAGLAIDPKPSNFLYDQKVGFGIIDYQNFNEKTMKSISKSDQVLWLSTMLTQYAGNHGDNPKYGTDEYTQLITEDQTHRVIMNNRFLDILEARHPDLLREAAEIQHNNNIDPHVYSHGLLGDVYNLPEGSIFEAYKERIIHLGLNGQEPVVHDYSGVDMSVID